MPKLSVIHELGAEAPDFALPEVTDGAFVTLADVVGERGLVVMFLCQHCPYVKHVQHEIAAVARDYGDRGVGFVGIMSNDIEIAPDDAPALLAKQKTEVGFNFPYLHDESQAIALAYGAACTPDFFVFDSDRRLVYRGRLDAARPGGAEPDGAELRAALDALVSGAQIPDDQVPSIGCSIKWRAGNEPDVAVR